MNIGKNTIGSNFGITNGKSVNSELYVYGKSVCLRPTCLGKPATQSIVGSPAVIVLVLYSIGQ